MKINPAKIKSPLSYRFLLVLLSPVIFLITLKKVLNGGGKLYLQQRFAFLLPNIKNADWFHGASVGEINALLPLVSAYIKRHPKQNLLITCNTPTALHILKKQTWENVNSCYLPLDFVNTTKRFINKLKPSRLIIMETELWPNLYAQCANANCAITTINGRLSDKTLHANKLILNAYRFCMARIKYVYARTEQDRLGFITLGISPTKTQVLGNIKYQTPILKDSSNAVGRSFILLASSHDDEEIQIAKMWQHHILAKSHLLVIAPRHPERGKKIAKQLEILGLNVTMRSKKQTITTATQIYIADTIGEMATWYQHCNLVIMAGSFINHGGQNFIEPASYGKAIITGPYTHNFTQDIEHFLQHNAILQVKNIDELNSQLGLFLSTPWLFNELAKNAKLMMQDDIVETYLNVLD